MRKVSTFYDTFSNHALQLVAELQPETILGQTSSPCDRTSWLDEVQARASNWDSFAFHLLVNASPGCSNNPDGIAWFGRAAMVQTHGFAPYVIEHELGHVLNLAHAHSATCRYRGAPSTIGHSATEDCIPEEYGDVYSVMGWGRALNAAQLAFLGWANIPTITASGNYRSPVRIARGAQDLIVQITGHGVTLRLAARTAPFEAWLLDASPPKTPWDPNLDFVLYYGRWFCDPYYHVRLAPMFDFKRIAVRFAQTCKRNDVH